MAEDVEFAQFCSVALTRGSRNHLCTERTLMNREHLYSALTTTSATGSCFLSYHHEYIQLVNSLSVPGPQPLLQEVASFLSYQREYTSCTYGQCPNHMHHGCYIYSLVLLTCDHVLPNIRHGETYINNNNDRYNRRHTKMIITELLLHYTHENASSRPPSSHCPLRPSVR